MTDGKKILISLFSLLFRVLLPCLYVLTLFIKNPIIFRLLKICYTKLHQLYFNEFNMPFKNVRLWKKDFL